MIFWHGISSDDVNLIVEHYPARPIPKRKTEVFSIPGRSGDIIQTEDAWENVIQPYDIYLSAEEPGLPIVARKAIEWLMVPGYQRLEDSYDPDIFRLAAFTGGQELENILNMFGRATIEFNCKPQRYLVSGARFLKLSNGGSLVNPTGYTALPTFRVYGSGAGVLTVGSYSLSLSDCDSIALDCEEEEAFRFVPNLGTNLNSTVSGDYPRLSAGSSKISWSGGIRAVDVAPRWYSL